MEVLFPIASSLFVIGLLSGLLLLARRAAGSKSMSFGSSGRRWLFPFPRLLNPGGDDQTSVCVLKQAVLTPSHRVHLLMVAGQKVLLCTHPQGCTVIPASANEIQRVALRSEDWNQSRTQQPGERSAG